MKIYDAAAPNPRRLRMYLAEKGIEVDYESVDIFAGDQQKPEFLQKNPLGMVPVLELDDGTCISESFAIINYFEQLHPTPALLGMGIKQHAQVIMWDRRMEWEFLRHVGNAFRHKSKFFEGKIKQFPGFGDDSAEHARASLTWLNQELKNRSYIAGDYFSLADITAFITVQLGTPSIFSLNSDLPHIGRWYERISARPSSAA